MKLLSFVTAIAGVAAVSPELVSLQDRGFLQDIWDDIEEATTCGGCHAVLTVLKGLSHLGDGIFVSTISGICKLTNLVDDDVCEGAVELEGPVIAGSLREMGIGSKVSSQFCTTFLGLCDYPDVEEWDVPFPSAKPPVSRPEPSGQTPIKIVQFSDTHVDHQYTEGANTNCTKPICCRAYTDADAPGNNDSPAGLNGDHNCDPPASLEQSMLDAINTIVPDVAFGIFTGDIIDHAIWETTEESNSLNIQDMYNRVSRSLPLLYATMGNHEMSPSNAFPPTGFGTAADSVYSLLSGIWNGNDWISSSAAITTSNFGAYSTKFPGGNLRLISLNTNMYYIQNYFLYNGDIPRDPSGQFAWLVSELQQAEDAGERAYIFGHMPMGIKDAFHDGSNYFDQIVNRYEDTIAAMFFGHTHEDEFQVSYRDYSSRGASTAMAMSYITPSLTPTDGHPAFRVYTVDPETFAILDADTYIGDMDDASFHTSDIKWTKSYSARDAYGPLVSPPLAEGAELSPAFWHNVTEVFESDASALQSYVARRTRGWEPESCDSIECVEETVCMLRGGRAQDNCHEPEPGQDVFKKAKRGLNSEGKKVHRDECGVSVTRETLSALVGRRDLLEHVVKRAVEEGARVERRRKA